MPLFTRLPRWSLVDKVKRERSWFGRAGVVIWAQKELRYITQVLLSLIKVLLNQLVLHLRPMFPHLSFWTRWTLRSLQAHIKQNRVRDVTCSETYKCHRYVLYTYRPTCMEKLEEWRLLEERVREKYNWAITWLSMLITLLESQLILKQYLIL